MRYESGPYKELSPPSLFHIGTHPRVKAFLNMNTSLVPSFTHLVEHACLKPLSGRLSIQGLNCTGLSQSPLQTTGKTIGSDTTCWENRGGKHREIKQQ